MKEETWETSNDGDAETALVDNSHDEPFNKLMVACVVHTKWAQRLMYTLQTGIFDIPDHKCKTITTLLENYSDSLRSACYTLRADEDIDYDRNQR